jgi:hypothetical protein
MAHTNLLFLPTSASRVLTLPSIFVGSLWTMERSRNHAILFVGIALLAAAACATAEPCDTTEIADQLDSFCRPDEEGYRRHGTACCEAVRSAVETSLTVDPLCICHLEEEPAFIMSDLTIQELPDIYVACGGPNSRAVQLVADRCSGNGQPCF